MPENPQEQTEAKLLAYLEGELDEVGRADIERHLQVNPRHRKLLEEMSAGRRLLRLLPREVAPVELYEQVSSQFERQELLAGMSEPAVAASLGAGHVDPETGNYRLNKWGRIRAAAAVVLITGGLGALIYNIAAPQRPPSVVSSHGNGTSASNASDPKSDGGASVDFAANADAHAARNLRMAVAAERVRELPEVIDALGLAEADKAIDREGGNRFSRAPLKARGVGRSPSDEPLYLVIASNDAPAAKDQVMSLLSARGLAYSQVQPSAEREAGLVPNAVYGTENQTNESRAVPLAESASRSTSTEDILVVRRVPRARAEELLATLQNPTTGWHARNFGGPSDALAANTPPAAESSTASPEADRVSMAKQGETRGAIEIAQVPREQRDATPMRAAASQPEIFADMRMEKMPRTPATAPAGTPAIAAPSARAVAVLPPGNAPSSVPSPTPKPAITAAPSPAQPSVNLRATAGPPTTTPTGGLAGSATGGGGIELKDRSTQPAAIARSDAAPSAAKPAPAGPGGAASGQERSAIANPTNAPLRPDETIDLVYLDLRRNGQPVAQPMQVSPTGTIIVAGLGEVSLAGLTPAGAADKVSQAMKARNAAARGVEIRRAVPSSAVPTPAIATPAPAAVPTPAPDGQAQPAAPAAPLAAAKVADGGRKETQQNPPFEAAMPAQAAPSRVNPAEPPSPAIAQQSLTTDDADYVDLVIVVQPDGHR